VYIGKVREEDANRASHDSQTYTRYYIDVQEPFKKDGMQ